jgi:hypothetical protein
MRKKKRYEIVALWPKRAPAISAGSLRREKREALAKASAPSPPGGRRLFQSTPGEGEVQSPYCTSPGWSKVAEGAEGVGSSDQPPAVSVAVAGVEPDGGEVPAGFVRIGSELIRIGRDDVKVFAERCFLAGRPPFGRDVG